MPIKKDLTHLSSMLPPDTDDGTETVTIIGWVDMLTGKLDPNMPRIRADGKPLGIVQFFDQAHWWSNAQRQWVLIEDIDARYASNILNFLEQRAESYHFRYCLGMCEGPRPSGEMACDAFDAAMDELTDMDAGPWLRSTKLYQAILARVTAT